MEVGGRRSMVVVCGEFGWEYLNWVEGEIAGLVECCGWFVYGMWNWRLGSLYVTKNHLRHVYNSLFWDEAVDNRCFAQYSNADEKLCLFIKHDSSDGLLSGYCSLFIRCVELRMNCRAFPNYANSLLIFVADQWSNTFLKQDVCPNRGRGCFEYKDLPTFASRHMRTLMSGVTFYQSSIRAIPHIRGHSRCYPAGKVQQELSTRYIFDSSRRQSKSSE